MNELEDFFAQPIEPQGQGLEEAFASPVSVESESNATEEIDFLQLGMDMVQSANDGLAKLEAQEPLPDVEQVSQEQGIENLSDNVDTLFGSGMGGMGASALGANPAGVTMASLAYPMHKTGTQVMDQKGIPRSEPYDYNKHGISLEPVLPVDVGRPVKAFNDMVRPTAIGTIETLKGLGEMVVPKGTSDSFKSSAEREDYYRSDSASTSPSELIRPKN